MVNAERTTTRMIAIGRSLFSMLLRRKRRQSIDYKKREERYWSATVIYCASVTSEKTLA